MTVSPPPLDTDEDFLCLCHPDAVSWIMNFLKEQKFKWEGASEHYENVAAEGFMSWRRFNINLIVTSSRDFAMRHQAATNVCKLLNVLDKKQRIAIFQAALYGKFPEKETENGQQDSNQTCR